MGLKRIIKNKLLRICLRLQAPPFTILFRFYYFLAIKVSVMLVSRIDNAAAVYVSGSLGGGRAIFGLSDIDLNIFFHGPESARLSLRIRLLFRRLKIIFPMLGSPEEKGIYFLETFRNNYLRYPMIRHLFDPASYPQKLVWGEDLLASIVPEELIDEKEKRLRMIWKLRYWMEKTVIFSESPQLTDIQITHLFYKAVTNIFSICKGMTFTDPDGSSAALPLQKTLDPSAGSTWKQLQLTHENLYLSENPSPELCFSLFKQLLHTCLEPNVVNPAEKQVQELRFVLDSEKSDGTFLPGCSDRIQLICGRETRVEIRPFSYIPAGILDSGNFALPAILVSPSAPLILNQIHELRDLYSKQIMGKAVLLIQESEHFIYAVHPELLEHWIYEPLEGSCLYSAWYSRVPCEDSLVDLLRRLVFQASEIQDVLKADKLDRIEKELSWKILFTGIQRMLLLTSLRIHYGLSAELLEGWKEHLYCQGHPTPGKSPPSDRLTQGKQAIQVSLACDPLSVCKALRKTDKITTVLLDSLEAAAGCCQSGNRAYPSLKNGLRLLGRLSRIAAGEEAFDSLARINPVPRLSISAVVVTRNRSAYLKSCLEALHQQSRMPDEIVIIDNGSTDETAKVVEKFSESNLVRYVYEGEIGISHARNIGVKSSRGDIIAFVDDDAVADTAWLAGIETVFEENSDVGIVGGAIHTLTDEHRRDLVYRYHCASYQEGTLD